MTKPTLLMTRPLRQSQGFVARLDPAVMAGVRVVTSPVLEIVATGSAPDLGPYDGVIFTSAQAVEFAPEGQGTTVYCVGARTAEAAQGQGWVVAHVAQTAADLIAALSKGQARRLLHLAGRYQRGDIAESLQGFGKSVDVHVLYDQQARALSFEAHEALVTGDSVIVPLFSPRSAALFAGCVPHATRATVIALSSAVAEALGGLAVAEITVAAAPTAKEMIASVEKLLRHPSLP